MSSMAHATSESLPSQSDRPERSRNAKAQARHRAKRKAYIEQLEQTVTKLQTALGFTPDQVATLPPPLVKIRELEQENVRLQKENDELRRLLGEPDHRNHHLSSDYRRPSLPAFHDSRSCDRELKKRKMTDDLYMGPDQHTDNLSRPPPLTIPQPLSHHYNNIPSHHNSSNHVTNSSSSLFSLHGPAFQMPNTPSGSSSTSSPPFSQPAQMQPSSHSPLNHRPSSLSHHALSNYSHSNHYGSVKVEDENFGQQQQSNHHTHNGHGHSGHYQTTLPPFAQTAPEPDLDSWHTYSAERAQVHR